MNRRDLLGFFGSLAGTASLASAAPDQLWARARAIDAGSDSTGTTGPFTPHQFQTVSRLTDLMIPPTDTPGAREAKVPEFIAVIVGEWYPDEERSSFMAGLEDLDVRSRQAFGKTFVEGAEADQVGLLRMLDDEVTAIRARKGRLNDNFFQRIKGLTLYGYYTSEIGMNQELHYQMIPGRYAPCPPA